MKNVLGLINLHENEELLKELTRLRPLAAVPFGGRYRLIDFVLSNMVNSGIVNVGIVVKHKYRSIMDHLRSGKEWDLARKRDGLFILPPPDHTHYANSIYKGDLEHFHTHVDYLERSTQEYVIVAGSHTIYNTDYREAFRYHLEKQADITILYKDEQPAPGKQFSLATVLTVADDGRVTDIHVATGRVAAGPVCLETYIMRKELLLQIIEVCIARGEYDFVKEGIVKRMDQYRVFGFPFTGYMAKINSVQSYFRANMDLLHPEIWQDLYLKSGAVYTKVKDEPPANYRDQAAVGNVLVANGCVIEGRVENSVLFRSVKVHRGAYV
ncbi:MAG TPA: glucose-1-phosphate adenylyltransferase subunit GlgD, partial [Negativicutes bacterium]|nr:glucose-1-phosphate adenylyltransferase subunit GlgD [Negativicutes bacterium]